jgi:hypothetical protein
MELMSQMGHKATFRERRPKRRLSGQLSRERRHLCQVVRVEPSVKQPYTGAESPRACSGSLVTPEPREFTGPCVLQATADVSRNFIDDHALREAN